MDDDPLMTSVQRRIQLAEKEADRPQTPSGLDQLASPLPEVDLGESLSCCSETLRVPVVACAYRYFGLGRFGQIGCHGCQHCLTLDGVPYSPQVENTTPRRITPPAHVDEIWEAARAAQLGRDSMGLVGEHMASHAAKTIVH